MALTQVDQGLLGTYAQYTGFKNRIINGNMTISQRNGTSTVATPTDGQYVLDRYATFTSGGGVYSVGQSSTAPAGFTNSMVCTVTTVDSSIAATDYYLFCQTIEGYNVADLGFGTANAQTVTVSFWVRSSITGTFGFGLRQGSGTRSYVATYTISSANTWEQKTITIAGDTSGTWDTTNGAGMIATWDLGSGSNRNGTANTWNAGNLWRTSACTNLIANSGATLYITGVQLEKGSTATSFDYRPYGTELALCQRYGLVTPQQQNSGDICGTSTNTNVKFQFPVTMRTAPTASLITAGSWIVGNGYSANYTASSVSISSSALTTQGGRVALGGFSAFGSNFFVSGSDAVGTAVLFMSAEL
jgi:hypothetical protein